MEQLKNELAAQEAQWKEAYDFLLAENQSLKTSGSEALLAAQWRQRYETCLSEKEDLEARLAMEVEKADASAEQRRKVDAGKYEMKYRDLKESFRLYRKKAKEIFEAQQRGDIGVSGLDGIELCELVPHNVYRIGFFCSFLVLPKRVQKTRSCPI